MQMEFCINKWLKGGIMNTWQVNLWLRNAICIVTDYGHGISIRNPSLETRGKENRFYIDLDLTRTTFFTKLFPMNFNIMTNSTFF